MAQSVQAMDTAAKELNVALLRFPARGPADLEGAFAAMAKERVEALAVVEDVGLIPNSRMLAELAVKRRLPSISFIEYAEAGGLFGYGVNFLALYRRAPVFVDKILRGAKPADIPIERPTTFEFVINMKTAKTLGLTVPSSTRVRADREIE
jgi:putative ABC transport system substrate-binding protein